MVILSLSLQKYASLVRELAAAKEKAEEKEEEVMELKSERNNTRVSGSLITS